MAERGRINILGCSIGLLAYDFDGVMTDNSVLVHQDGTESVFCNRGDGLAIAILKRNGIPQIIISTETNKVVKSRAEKLGIPVVHGTINKTAALFDFCKTADIKPGETLFIGNDINDIDVMGNVGIPCCPHDACREIQDISKLIIPASGGRGVIRALLNIILAQNKGLILWNEN